MRILHIFGEGFTTIPAISLVIYFLHHPNQNTYYLHTLLQQNSNATSALVCSEDASEAAVTFPDLALADPSLKEEGINEEDNG